MTPDPPKRILIADDDDTLLFAFNAIFKGRGLIIDSSSTVEHAKELISLHDYDLIITDWQFTDRQPQGGEDIIRYVRAQSPGSRVLLFSGYDQEDRGAIPPDAAPDYFLRKPVKSEDIEAIISRAPNGRTADLSGREGERGV